MADKINIDPVALVHSPFDEKFGIPRQAGLVPLAMGEVRFRSPYDDPGMLEGLEGFSHVWLTFQFHQCVSEGWRARVRPPRLGGNKTVGVWASRSPYRPNFLGLSVVRLLEVVTSPAPLLRVAGVDLLDGTPVVDIKPYLPYSDALRDAHGGFADRAPDPALSVRFVPQAETDCAAIASSISLRELIIQVLALDPRPAYRQGAEPGRRYGMRLAGCEVQWRVTGEGVEVLAVRPLD
jgi:tRNA-Thr(GGU) m(6)t(6)A37 methyltransferase TsaA